jgi:hypothetical protein
LQAPEPLFRLGLRRLEAANGNPNADIQFSHEVLQATLGKLRALDLDPRDTTAEELYHVLQERLRADDARLTKRLRTTAATYVSAEGDVVAGMIQALKQLPDSRSCYALKSSSLKAIIKKLPPKKAMKSLGYRSLDSMLKHETPISVLAAAWMCEGHSWQQHLLEQYKHLKPGDFEDRSISLIQPASSKRWRELSARSVSQTEHNLLCFKELGTLVFLPLPDETPPGAVTVSLSLALHDLNQIRAGSSYLKLCQIRPDFGSLVKSVASGEPWLHSAELDQPVSWHLIQRYYGSLMGHFREELFEPHIQLEDLAWHPIEQALAAIEPSFSFWQDSAHLGLLDGKQPVSLNIVDVALNYCNKLPFEQRVVHYFQQSLWHELLLRYLRSDTVEQAVLTTLEPDAQLVKETIAA